MTYSQYNDFLTFHIEDYTVISDAKTVTSQLRISKGFGVLVRIVQIAKKGFSDAFPDISAKCQWSFKSVPILVNEKCTTQPSGGCLSSREGGHVFTSFELKDSLV